MKISLSNIGKQYGNHWIFKNVLAEFEVGKIYAITGHNGSGKSTLLQIISGFITPSTGEINYLLAEEVIKIEEWYKHLSITAPYLELFEEFTVREAIELHHQLKALTANPDLIIKDIDLETHQEKQLKQLSSGMKQRLKLALTLYSTSEIILLDEPCSNLDQRWMDWYNDRIALIQDDKVIIISSNNHREELRLLNTDPLDLTHATFH